MTNSDKRIETMAEKDLDGNFEEFWKDILFKDGKLDMDQLKRELYDFNYIMTQVPKVYGHITNFKLSKPNYEASVVIGEADDRQQEYFEELLKEETEELREEVDRLKKEIEHLTPLAMSNERWREVARVAKEDFRVMRSIAIDKHIGVENLITDDQIDTEFRKRREK